MSSGQRAALELTEAAREVADRTVASPADCSWARFDFASPAFPAQSTEDRDQGDAFLQKLEKLLREKVDPDEIDRTRRNPGSR